jgi:hypothetical protein
MRCKSIPTLTPKQEERFWSRVDVPYQPSCCWEWNDALTPKGYGRFYIGDDSYQAHRVAYALLIGQPDPNLTLDHLCRNRKCINPDHTEEVTNKQNILRGYTPIAQNKRKTACPKGHPLTPDNVYLRADGSRRCRICTCAYVCKRQREARAAQRTLRLYVNP